MTINENLIFGAVSILSFFFAIYQYKEKRQLMKTYLSQLQGINGNICKIHQSTDWAFAHFRGIKDIAVDLSESEIKKEILKKACDGQGDASAADRMLENLFVQAMAFQKAQFDNDYVSHPEKNKLPLWIRELESRKADAIQEQ